MYRVFEAPSGHLPGALGARVRLGEDARGSWLPGSYATAQLAADYCREQLSGDAARVFHVVGEDGVVAETVLNREFLEYLATRDEAGPSAWMGIFVYMALAAAGIWSFMPAAAMPYILVGFCLLYAIALVLFGPNSYLEMAVPFTILLILMAVALPAWEDYLDRRQRLSMPPPASAPREK